VCSCLHPNQPVNVEYPDLPDEVKPVIKRVVWQNFPFMVQRPHRLCRWRWIPDPPVNLATIVLLERN
jgi:hypothetical protein